MDLLPFELKDWHLVTALVIKILILVFAWWKIKFLTALAGGLDEEKRKLKEDIQTHIDNEAVLKREINQLNFKIAELEDDLEHTSKNSSDFENEMGNAQLEVLELKDKIKLLNQEKADLTKKLGSQKAHFGKQKKKIETLQSQVEGLDQQLFSLQEVFQGVLIAGYFKIGEKYFKAVSITAPSQKKMAQAELDKLKESKK